MSSVLGHLGDSDPRCPALFSLTLVKGDEVVDVPEEGADEALLGKRRNLDFHARKHWSGYLEEC